MAITFPDITPEIFTIGGFSLRWYALAYIAGLFGGLKYAEYLIQKSPPVISHFTKKLLEDLFTYVAIGVILGGRLGYVLFYKLDYYLQNPEQILQLWNGGMSFHGGLLGVIIGVLIFAYRNNIHPLTVGDYTAPAVPIGLFFGRIANFINAELYGRPTDFIYGVRFPDPYQHGLYLEPRHASQIYEALTEGLCLFILLYILSVKKSCLYMRGKITAVFLMGYGIARIFCEFFREPDSFLGFIMNIYGVHITQGMILCVPMIMLGGYIYMIKKPYELK